MPSDPFAHIIDNARVLSKEISMRIIYLEPTDTFILDVLAWIILQPGIGYWSVRFPEKWLDPSRNFFHSFPWEKEGSIYQKLFHVCNWKNFIPDGSKVYRGAFSIKHLPSHDSSYLLRWLKESDRSELCRWFMIFPSVFFFWNNETGGWLMVLYAFLNNLVPIILQRFNRPRMRQLIAEMQAQYTNHEPALARVSIHN
jgi:glycosyl-4,4'-diaponeurosporenoate acyltransferase